MTDLVLVFGDRTKICVVCVFVKVQRKFEFTLESGFVHACVEVFDIQCLVSDCVLVFLVCEVEIRHKRFERV